MTKHNTIPESYPYARVKDMQDSLIYTARATANKIIYGPLDDVLDNFTILEHEETMIAVVLQRLHRETLPGRRGDVDDWRKWVRVATRGYYYGDMVGSSEGSLNSIRDGLIATGNGDAVARWEFMRAMTYDEKVDVSDHLNEPKSPAWSTVTVESRIRQWQQAHPPETDDW